MYIGVTSLAARSQIKSIDLNRMIERTQLFERIKSGIDTTGYFLMIVAGKVLPRFAYTIGGKGVFGSEVILAGAELYSRNDVANIFHHVFKELKEGVAWRDVSISIDTLGSFSRAPVEQSSCKLLALGAFSYYNEEEIEAFQILPDKNHRTLDVPDLSSEFSTEAHPIWQFLTRECYYRVPDSSMAITNLDVLFGIKATEAMRWEENEWEIFAGAGPDVPKEDLRIVPLAVLIGIDPSLKSLLELTVGTGLWRDDVELVWNKWESAK